MIPTYKPANVCKPDIDILGLCDGKADDVALCDMVAGGSAWLIKASREPMVGNKWWCEKVYTSENKIFSIDTRKLWSYN